MKRNINWLQLIGVLTPILLPVIIFLISVGRTQATQALEIQNIKDQQYSNQLQVQKEFDKTQFKLDKIIDAQADQRVLIENKQNRR